MSEDGESECVVTRQVLWASALVGSGLRFSWASLPVEVKGGEQVTQFASRSMTSPLSLNAPR